MKTEKGIELADKIEKDIIDAKLNAADTLTALCIVTSNFIDFVVSKSDITHKELIELIRDTLTVISNEDEQDTEK